MYAKIFSQVFDSSIADNYRVRHFFMDLLVLSDENGIVDATPEAISCRTRIPIKLVKQYLTELSKPDPLSRSRDQNGKRIVLIDPRRTWGWRIVNHAHYRAIKNRRDRAAYMAEYMRKRRAVKSNAANEVNNVANGGLMGANPASASEYVPGKEGVGENHSPSELIRSEKELKRVEDRIESIRSFGTQSPTGTNYTQEQRQEFKALRDRREELKKALGFLA